MKYIRNSLKAGFQIVKQKDKNFFYIFYYFIKILYFCLRYDAKVNDYMKLRYYEKNRKERETEKPKLISLKHNKKKIKKDRILISKYSSPKYEYSVNWRRKRNKDYKKHFNMGNGCKIGYNVCIRSAHNIISSKFICGNKVSISRNTDIDYTGDLEVGNGVTITEGVKILTHGHDFLGTRNNDVIPNTDRVYLTNLIIDDNVFIGSRSIIMPGVGTIGKNALIQAGSVVRKNVPPNTVVAGNQAKVITEFPVELRYNKITNTFGGA
jgi:acetyltransferase-like isoleucine patch superfamily enzyme